MKNDCPHILLVDDERFILGALRLYFESNDFEVSTASDGDEALRVFKDQHHTLDVAILDLIMPGTQGFDLLQEFKAIRPEVQVIIATGCGTMANAVEALHFGAFDFVTKPILDFETDLMDSVRNAVQILSQDNQRSDGRKSWLEVCSQLREVAARSRRDDPRDDLLEALGEILQEEFGASAAAVFALKGRSEMEPVQAWGFGEDWHERCLASIPSPEQPDRCEGWARVLTVRLHSLVEPQSVLSLYFEKEVENPADDPARGPLSLLSAVLSPLMNRRGPVRSPREDVATR